MSDYKKMYLKLSGATTNSIEEMQKAMQEAEENYIEKEDSFTVQYFPKKEEENNKE